MSRYQLQWHASADDPLAEALHALRLTGTFYCRSELSEPWGFTLPLMPGCMWFHALLSGRATLSARECEPLVLAPGSFVLAPHGSEHQLMSSPNAHTPVVLDLPHETVSDHYALLRHGGGGAKATLVCGVIQVNHHLSQNLLRVLPPLIHIEGFAPEHSEWMSSTLRLMASESQQRATLGGEAVVTRLADILVIQAIRAWLQSAPSATGWLCALRDPKIGKALAAVHRDLAHEWTVASLAEEAAMSRSAFAARFSELLAESPMRYLTRVRMAAASSLIEAEKNLSIEDAAARVGYQSEAAFRRRFRRFSGDTPGSLRARPEAGQ